MQDANDAIKKLLLKKKRDDKGASTVDTSVVWAPPVAPKRARPEDKVPDIPQNARVRDYLRKALPGACPLGEEVTLSQCWRCKLYGHATGARECPYFTTGNIELEAERRVREDPLPPRRNAAAEQDALPPPPPPLALAPEVQAARAKKLASLNELLASVTREEAARSEAKRARRAAKRARKEEEKRAKRGRAEERSADDVGV